MAAIVKSWLETHCPKCEERRTFTVGDGWKLVCQTCGEERKLDKNGLLAA